MTTPVLAYKLNVDGSEVFVLLNATHSNDRQPIQYRSDDNAAISTLRSWLQVQSGMYGHLIGENTTPIDLEFAMTSPDAKPYSPTRISGGELIMKQRKQPKGWKT